MECLAISNLSFTTMESSGHIYMFGIFQRLFQPFLEFFSNEMFILGFKCKCFKSSPCALKKSSLPGAFLFHRKLS